MATTYLLLLAYRSVAGLLVSHIFRTPAGLAAVQFELQLIAASQYALRAHVTTHKFVSMPPLVAHCEMQAFGNKFQRRQSAAP
jgi:hypothetical protein